MLGRFFLRSPTVAIVLAFAWTSAFAARAMEEVVVTGSYIPGSAEDAAFPVQVLDRAEIVASAATDVGELMRNLEINSGAGGRSLRGSFPGQAAGLAP